MLAAAVLLGGAAGGWRWHLPAGVAPPPVPAGNAMTAAKVELGRRLFYDGDLSIDGTMSCATCHEQKRGFADGNRTHPGVHGDPARRNVPGLANVAWQPVLTWADPRLTSLEAQIAVPILGDTPVEMGMKGEEAELARRLSADACYVTMFARAFPETQGKIDLANVSNALAAFQRTLIAFDTPYDRGQMPPEAERGRAAFQRDCASCHAGPHFSDGRYHRLEPAGSDRGAGEISGRVEEESAFRTPGLRNVALTAPYLHDGSEPTLAGAIRRHGLAYDEDLLSFLAQLTDTSFVTDKRFTYPDEACGKPL